MTWRPWLGIPFRPQGSDRMGCDCWGLVQLVYRERYGVLLPSVGPYDLEDATELIAQHRARWTEVSDRRDGDVVLLLLDGTPSHVGILVASDQFLHTLRGHVSRIDRLTHPVWRGRVAGIYRWQ